MESDEKQNQSAGTSSDPQDRRLNGCQLSQEQLLASTKTKLDVLDFCPICKTVAVGAHPTSQPAAPTGAGLTSIPEQHVLVQEFRSLRLELVKGLEQQSNRISHLASSIPPAIYGKRLTPSDAMKSERGDDYKQTLNQLGLRNDPDVDEADFKAPTNAFPPWSWSWKGKKERESYEPATAHIEAVISTLNGTVPQLFTAQVSEGKGLTNGKLFEVVAHTLRRQIGQTGVAADVRFIRTIAGRSDIAVGYGVAGNDIRRDNTAFVVEVKPTKEWIRSRREATVQLLGLNIANLLHTPPVMLTDLVDNHEVLYLHRKSTDPLEYAVCVKCFKEFTTAIVYTLTLRLGHNARQSCDFGRGVTPPASDGSGSSPDSTDRSPAPLGSGDTPVSPVSPESPAPQGSGIQVE